MTWNTKKKVISNKNIVKKGYIFVSLSFKEYLKSVIMQFVTHTNVFL